MKQTALIIALFSLFFTGCNKKETIITGQYIGESKTLAYTVPIYGTIYMSFSDTINLDENGNFSLKLEITQPAFIYIWNKEKFNGVKLFVEPGENYHLVTDIENDTQISGTNEKGQMLYATLSNPFYVEEMITREIFYDTSLVSIHNKMEASKQDDISKLKKLLDNKEISEFFFDLAKIDRDCYYAALEAMVLIMKMQMETNAPENSDKQIIEISNDLIENIEKVFSQYPPDDEKMMVSSFWSQYAHVYIDYKLFYANNYDKQKHEELRIKGLSLANFIDESKKYLTGKALEFNQARHIDFHGFVIQEYDKELITLFEQFKKDYPKSEYSKYIKPWINEIVLYHKMIEKPFDEAVIFMDNYENINTLEEAIKPLKGKKIYIDIWATWCEPCKVEFKNNEALKKILAESDIQQLYISIDRDQRDQQWKEGIKFFELTGTHIRANRELTNDLYKLFNAENPGIAIPWYILIDEEGKIMEKHAKNPSQLVSGESLF